MHTPKHLIDNWSEYKDPRCGLSTESKYSSDLINFLSPREDEIILDNGCGNGRLSRIMEGKGSVVISLDVNDQLIRVTRNAQTNQSMVILSDIQHLPFRRGVFNKVLCIHNLWYVPHYSKSVDEMFRVTVGGGVIIWDHIAKKWQSKDVPVYRQVLWQLHEVSSNIRLLMLHRKKMRISEQYIVPDHFLAPIRNSSSVFFSVPFLSLLYLVISIIIPVTLFGRIGRGLLRLDLVPGFKRSAHRWVAVCTKEKAICK